MIRASIPGDRSYFRKYNIIAGTIALSLVAFLVFMISSAAHRDTARADKRKADVAEFRAAFMTDCLDAGRRPHECIVMWSQVKIDDWR